MANSVPRMLGIAYAVPENIRTNDAPVFDWLKEHAPSGQDLFQGYNERRVLSRHEDLMTIMLPAALQALKQAEVAAADVDLLLGVGSVSPFITPNELSRLHQQLGLPERAWVVPLSNDFSNFNAGVVMADALLRSQRAQTVLIVIGGNWTRYVDYHTPQAISAADGAAAAVMGLSQETGRWQLVDQQTITQASYFGTMFLGRDSIDLCPPQEGYVQRLTPPTFHITTAGQEGFQRFGVEIAPQAVQHLLTRQGLTGADITLISHQASSVLLNAWARAIAPAQYINTLKQFGNMTVANVPINLAWAHAHEPIENNHLVLLAIGTDMHANALLLERME